MLQHPLRVPAAVVCLVLFSSAVVAGSATIKINVVDDTGQAVADALFMFQMIDDPEQHFTVNQNDAGSYEATVEIPVDDALWSVAKVVSPGLLPVKVTLQSLSASGETLQAVEGIDVDPANPIPPVKIRASGTVLFDITLGDQAVVMEKFRAARAAAREAAQAEHAAAAPSGAHAEAVRLYNAGDFEGSIAAFQAVLKERPDDAELKVAYAGALYKAKRFEEFEAAAREALAQDPQQPNLWMMLYSSSRDRGDLRTALEALLSAKKLGGGQDLLPHLTFIAQKLGPTAEAIPAYEALLDLDAQNLAAVVGLASVHEMAGRGETAQGYLDRAVRLAPGGAYKLYFDLAVKLLGKPAAQPSDIDRAIALLEKAVALKPDSVEAQRRLGLACWQRGNHAGAAVALRKYLTLKPDADDRAKIAEYLNSLPK